MRILRRMWVAWFLAPLTIIPTVFIVVFGVFLVDIIQFDFIDPDRRENLGNALEIASQLAFLGIFVGWFLTLVIGFPTFAILRLIQMDHPLPCALVGAVFGVLYGTEFGHSLEPLFLVTMPACGAAVAYSFAAIVNAVGKAPPGPLYPDESVS